MIPKLVPLKSYYTAEDIHVQGTPWPRSLWWWERWAGTPEREDMILGPESSKKARKRGAYKKAFWKGCSQGSYKGKKWQKLGTQQCQPEHEIKLSSTGQPLPEGLPPTVDRKSCLQNVWESEIQIPYTATVRRNQSSLRCDYFPTALPHPIPEKSTKQKTVLQQNEVSADCF